MTYVDLELTRRERQFLELVGIGLNDGEIASKLGITVGTTKLHGHRLRDKLLRFSEFSSLTRSGNSRVMLAFIAVSLGLAQVPERIVLLNTLCSRCRALVTCGLEPQDHECFPHQESATPETKGHAGDPQNPRGQVI